MLVIAAVVLVVLAVLIYKIPRDELDRFTMFLFIPMLAGMVIGTPGTFIVGELFYKTEDTTEVQLVALRDSSTTTGSFFLGTGYIDGQLVYRFLYNGVGGIRTIQVPASNVVLQYGSPARASQTITRSRDARIALVVARYSEWTIVIPEGSLITDYQVDLR